MPAAQAGHAGGSCRQGLCQPETWQRAPSDHKCCARGQAVLYFRRALKLNRHYLSAWTLMGHEYVEMKNPPAAIGALPLTFNGLSCC